MESGEAKEPLHVFDLPQLYRKPSANELKDALDLLTLKPTNFGEPEEVAVQPEGVTNYLTTIISSPLVWIEDDDEREQILEKASKCLAQRAGRTAMGDITRSFKIPLSSSSIEIELHEPGLTGDDLGHKTWSTSYELAKLLHTIWVPPNNFEPRKKAEANVLELGAGTGLMGITAAAAWKTSVLLTDLPSIVPNLKRNINGNSAMIAEHGGEMSSAVLDWKKPEKIMVNGKSLRRPDGFNVIVAADPIYSPDHPAMFTKAVVHWLAKNGDARLMLAYPLREAYDPQIAELRRLLTKNSLNSMGGCKVEGRDDWNGKVHHIIDIYHWSYTKGYGWGKWSTGTFKP